MLSPESKLIAGFGGVVLGFLCILASPAMSIYGCFHGPPTLWPLLPLFIGALLVPFGYYLGVKAVRVMDQEKMDEVEKASSRPEDEKEIQS